MSSRSAVSGRERTPRGRLQIAVQMLSGRTIPLDIRAGYTVQSCKWQLYMTEGPTKGIHPAQQRLIFEGHDLDPGRTMSDYNIQPESELSLIVDPLSGPLHQATTRLAT